MNNTIYFIDQSIQYELLNRKLSMEEEMFFQKLAISYQQGKCYLCGAIHSIDALIKSQTGITGKIYCAVKNHYSESGVIMKAVQRVFVLTYQETPSRESLPVILRDEKKCCFIHIQTAIREDWNLSVKCALLTENLDDIEFYLFIAKYYCLKKQIPYQQISFHKENGGGNTTCNVLEKCVTQDKIPVLCIVDSDRKHGTTKGYPNEPIMGDTLKRVLKKEERLKSFNEYPPFYMLPLHVHEIENLIPIQLLQKLYEDSLHDMRPGLERVMELKDIKCGEPLLYYDYKKGFPCMKNAPQRSYWEEILLLLGRGVAFMPPSEEPESGAGISDALFFPPLSNKLLKHTLDVIRSDESDIFLRELQIDDYLKNIWDDIGKHMLTWGYVNEAVRA